MFYRYINKKHQCFLPILSCRYGAVEYYHCVFAYNEFVNNNESVAKVQHVFRYHFNVRRQCAFSNLLDLLQSSRHSVRKQAQALQISHFPLDVSPQFAVNMHSLFMMNDDMLLFMSDEAHIHLDVHIP